MAEAADRLYDRLVVAGIEVLYDDRDVSPGVKFADADLLGMPVRLVVGGKGLARGMVEWRSRTTGEEREVAVDAPVADLVGVLGPTGGPEGCTGPAGSRPAVRRKVVHRQNSVKSHVTAFTGLAVAAILSDLPFGWSEVTLLEAWADSPRFCFGPERFEEGTK